MKTPISLLLLSSLALAEPVLYQYETLIPAEIGFASGLDFPFIENPNEEFSVTENFALSFEVLNPDGNGIEDLFLPRLGLAADRPFLDLTFEIVRTEFQIGVGVRSMGLDPVPISIGEPFVIANELAVFIERRQVLVPANLPDSVLDYDVLRDRDEAGRFHRISDFESTEAVEEWITGASILERRDRLSDAAWSFTIDEELKATVHPGLLGTGERFMTSVVLRETSIEPRTIFAGDTDKDGDVDFVDFLNFQIYYDYLTGELGRNWANGDFNGDQVVTFPDFLLLAKNYGTTTVAPVPEPSGWILVLLCLVSSAASRRLWAT